jgi:hypothetical protein
MTPNAAQSLAFSCGTRGVTADVQPPRELGRDAAAAAMLGAHSRISLVLHDYPPN